MAIAFDNSKDGGSTSSSTTHTYSHTVGSGDSRILFVGVLTNNDTTHNVTGVTYNGVAMISVVNDQLVQSGSSWYYSLWYLVAPATGANDVVITKVGTNGTISSSCASYFGASQTGIPDAFASSHGTGGTVTENITTVENDCWSILVGANIDANWSASINTTLRVAGSTRAFFDSGGAITPAGSFSQTITFGGTRDWGVIQASFSPAITLIEKNLSESIVLTDSISNKTIITLSEIISLISGIIHKAGKQLNETINPVATFTSISTILRVFTEIITIGAVIKNKTVKTISETISTVDSVLCKLSKQLNESINIVSSFSRLGTFLKTFLETVSITDILKNKAQKTFSEILSLTDLIKNKTVRLFSETLSLTDSIVRKTVRLFSEVVSITDVLKNKIQKTFSEVITIVDTTIVKTYKLFLETLSLIDSIKNKISKTFSETLSVTASIIKKITLDLLELIGITSTFSKLSTIIRSFSETISLTDWWKYGKTLSKGISILSTVVNKSITSLKTKGASILGTKNKDKTTL